MWLYSFCYLMIIHVNFSSVILSIFIGTFYSMLPRNNLLIFTSWCARNCVGCSCEWIRTSVRQWYHFYLATFIMRLGGGWVKVKMKCFGVWMTGGGGWQDWLFDSLHFFGHSFRQERGYWILLATVHLCVWSRNCTNTFPIITHYNQSFTPGTLNAPIT